MCDQYRALTRYGICDECYRAQDHLGCETPYWGTQFDRYVASHSLADLQKVKPDEDVTIDTENIPSLYKGNDTSVGKKHIYHPLHRSR
jgi:hypothetical protein